MIKATNLDTGIPIASNLTLESDKTTSVKFTKRRLLLISVFAVMLAGAVSVIARLLIYLINFFTNLSFFGRAVFNDASPADNTLGVWVIAVPVVGGLIVGLMALYGSKAIRGHGIPEAMEQILTNHSRIKPSIIYLKPLSAAISIGTGGPFGAEGPIISTGGAIGSTLGQLLHISHYERKILLAAGATAGMSAIFGTPVAAIFLAIELLLFEFSPNSIIPVALACITGAAGHHLLFGTGPVFPMPAVESPTNLALAVYSVMGLILGFLAAEITYAVYFIEDSFEKLPIHWMWWPAIGGLAVGIIGYFMPRTLGVGYDNITTVLAGNSPYYFILALCCLKFFSWAIALGSGTSGGTLAPLLTIGGAAGVIIGTAILLFFPNCGISLPMCGMVGMAAMFAGASRALLTSIVFAVEATGQTHGLLALLSACSGSYFVSYLMMENTIMTEKIARRGIKTPHTYEPDLLEKINVEDVADGNNIVIASNNNINDVRAWLKDNNEGGASHFIVVDAEGHFKGILNVAELYATTVNVNATVETLIKRAKGMIEVTASLRRAVTIMGNENVDVLPVIDPSKNNTVVSVLTYRNILSVYQQGFNEKRIQKPHLSLKKEGVRMLIKGQRLVTKISGKA